MKLANYKKWLLSAVFGISIANTFANPKLDPVFSDHMVLQRGKPILLSGTADADEKLSIKFLNQDFNTIANNNGIWQLSIPAQKEGGPYTLTVKGKTTVNLNDVLFGDVFICSGQSNMEWPLISAANGKQEVDEANFPQIRLYKVPRRLSLTPVNTINAQWQVCTPQSAKNFSAVAYFFARNLHKKFNVPIGLVESAWGGTVVETWISSNGLNGEETFGSVSKSLSTSADSLIKSKKAAFDEWNANFSASDKGSKNKSYIWQDGKEGDWKNVNLPQVWDNGAITELKDKDGVVWFKKVVNLAEADVKANATLNLGVIDDTDITFINGFEVGKTYDEYNTTRIYEVKPGVLKPGENTIVVRVEDYGGGGGLYGEPSDMNLKTAAKSYNLDGEWQYQIGFSTVFNSKPNATIGPNSLPTLLYNGMINPIKNIVPAGVIWYQGESNATRAFQYRDLFERLINDWRLTFKQPDLPFMFVQLANFKQKQNEPDDASWAELREAQAMALRLKNTGMATAIDIGNPKDIHPTNKQEVGRRLALTAQNIIYKQDIIDGGPIFEKVTYKNGAAIITFKNVGNGIKIKSNASQIKDISIAGNDKKFYWAEAEIIDKNKIKVTSASVKNPVAVRYAWEDNPEDANIINSENLPAFPFRTDNWKLLSAEAK